MREIPLTQGMVALVNDKDYAELSKYRWYAHKEGNTWYAVRHSLKINGKRHWISMHRSLLNPPINLMCDHINGNGLDNRRENLRIVSRRGNGQNRHGLKSSEFPGVYWDKQNKKWKAHIQINGKVYHIKYSNDESEASGAYRHVCAWIVGDGIIEPGPEQCAGCGS